MFFQVFQKAAKFQLSGIAPTNKSLPEGVWPRETQLAMQEMFENAEKSAIKLIPTKEWSYSREKEDIPSVPYVLGKISVNGVDMTEKLVSLGLVEKI